MKHIASFILALVLILSLAACAGAPDTAASQAASTPSEADSVMTHADYVAAALNTTVTVDTYVQAKQSWWEGKASFYTQAADGAYFIYQMPCTQEEYDALTPGTGIRVTGTKLEWEGEIEITDATFTVIEGRYLAQPLDVTALLGTDELEGHQNERVSFKGLTVAEKTAADGSKAAVLYGWDGSGKAGDDLYFDVALNGNTYTFTVESYLCGADTDVYKAVQALKAGDVVDLEGFLYWYDGPNPHITAATLAA